MPDFVIELYELLMAHLPVVLLLACLLFNMFGVRKGSGLLKACHIMAALSVGLLLLYPQIRLPDVTDTHLGYLMLAASTILFILEKGRKFWLALAEWCIAALLLFTSIV